MYSQYYRLTYGHKKSKSDCEKKQALLDDRIRRKKMLAIRPAFTQTGLRNFENIFDDFGRAFTDSFFTTPFMSGMTGSTFTGMKTDVRKEDGLYLMEVDLPGYSKEEINAELKDGYLTISAEHKSESEEKKDEGYVMKERRFGSCSRSFYVGEGVAEDDIKAAYRDGILHLSFPAEDSKEQIEAPKKILIEG